MQDMPVACSLDSHALACRPSDLRGSVLAEAGQVDRLPDGFRWTFAHTSDRPTTPERSTHAELTVWAVDDWRSDLWLVDGTPCLRLFNHERLASEIRILPHPSHEAWALANRWKALLTARSRLTG